MQHTYKELWKTQPKMGLIPLCAVGFVWTVPGDELCELSWGTRLKDGPCVRMSTFKLAEGTWEKCLNTHYFQRFMNSVLQ